MNMTSEQFILCVELLKYETFIRDSASELQEELETFVSVFLIVSYKQTVDLSGKRRFLIHQDDALFIKLLLS